MNVVLDPAALEELEEAVAWYERDYWGRGVRFRAVIEHTLRRIAENPLGFPERLGGRAVVVPRFPYVVFYDVVDDSTVVVRAVAHGRRQPEYWRQR